MPLKLIVNLISVFVIVSCQSREEEKEHYSFPLTQSVQKVVIAGGPHQTAHLPFNWSIYSDPSQPEFWSDGADGVLPRPFLHLAAEPTEENAKKLLAWQDLQWKTIDKIIKSLGGASELKQYDDLVGGNFLSYLSKEDPKTVRIGPNLKSNVSTVENSQIDWKKVGIVYIYRSGCPACKKQQPIINSAESLGAQIIALQLDEGPSLHKGSIPYLKGDWSKFFPIDKDATTPTIYFVHKGHPPKKHIGFISLLDLSGEIKNIIGVKNEG